MANRDISEGRKTIYYVGGGLMILGVLTFGSVFVTSALNFGNFDNFHERARSSGLRAISGMAMMIVGALVSNVGRVGLAGSGVILDPQQARKDVEPWSRMGGGMLKDTLDEAEIDLSGLGTHKTETPTLAEQLRELHALREEGILTEEEYQREKAEILERN
tara:strand:- start:215 stop:697 length:483 start_codon:yes stop_codon:yes gene_type:complete